MKLPISRRTVLRGAGVALTLPWLESLEAPARAQAAAAPKRFIPIFLPNGAPELWKPVATGTGAAWTLSSVLAPLAAHKSKISVVSGLETGSVFNLDGSALVEPAHGRQSGAWLTCMDPGVVRMQLNLPEANGVSADQLLAKSAAFAGQTPLESLQVGLSTVLSYCDGQPCSNSRSVSWSTQTTPMYKIIDPTELFNKITGVSMPGPGPGSADTLARRKSVLDAVLASANVARARVSTADKMKLDQFLDTVRSVEQKLSSIGNGASCPPAPKPNFPTVTPDGFRQSTAEYTRGKHADIMSQLVALALQCDLTRVISYMLDDERSEFVFDELPKRVFTANGSTAGVGMCPEWHAAMHGDADAHATIVWYMASKVATLCTMLSAIPEGNGTLLDNCVLFLGAATHGANHAANELPSLLIGGGGGALKTDQHVDLGKRPLRDLYFTLLNSVFGMNLADFGMDQTGASIKTISELLV